MNNRISHLFEPWSTLGTVSEFDEFVRRFWNNLEPRAVQHDNLSIWQNEHGAIVELSLPGIEREDIDTSIERSVVTVKATPKQRILEEGTVAKTIERPHEKIERTVQLPFDIQADQVHAVYKQGILSLTLPRSEAQRPKQISIAAG